jgi:hypothetical protein
MFFVPSLARGCFLSRGVKLLLVPNFVKLLLVPSFAREPYQLRKTRCGAQPPSAALFLMPNESMLFPSFAKLILVPSLAREPYQLESLLF